MVILRSTKAPYSYVNFSIVEECYESASVSSKNGCPTRLPPALHHKDDFAYKSLCTCMHMPLHAVHTLSVIVLPQAPYNKHQVCSQGLVSGKPHVASWSQSGHAL